MLTIVGRIKSTCRSRHPSSKEAGDTGLAQNTNLNASYIYTVNTPTVNDNLIWLAISDLVYYLESPNR